MSNPNKAIDKVRADEYRKMQADGYEPILKKSRWCLLKPKENLTEKQGIKLKDLLAYNLKRIRAFLLKEEFYRFREYTSPYWVKLFLDTWCTKVMRSKIGPMKKYAKFIRKHQPLTLNWFRAKKSFSSGIVEGLNNKEKFAKKKAYSLTRLNALK